MTDNHANTVTLPSVGLDAEDLYPIREVSRLTGVNPITLRAWERRYGLLVPHRTDSGHRLYSMADIERVRAVMAWIERGVAVSKVASILDRQASPQDRPVAASDQRNEGLRDELQAWQDRLIKAVERFDLRQLDRVYGQLFAGFPLAVVLRDVVMPVWRRFLGHGEPAGSSGQWAFLDAFLRGRLFQRAAYLNADSPTVMLVSLPGPQRELEVLVLAAYVAAAEADVLYLPLAPDFAELAVMAERSGCAALVLFGDRALDQGTLTRQLPRLGQALECPVAVVGSICELQSAGLERAGLVCLGEADPSITGRVRALLAGRLDN